MSSAEKIILRLLMFCGVLAGCKPLPEKWAEQYYQQGLRQKSNNQFQQAVQYFQAAVEQNPDHAGAQLELGMLLCRYGEHGGGIKHLLKAHELAPQTFQAVSYLGYAYQQRRNWTLAEAYYARAIQLSPNLVDVRQYLADVFEIQGKLEQAAQTLQALLEHFPNYDQAAVIQARVLTLLQPDNPDAYQQLADTHVRLGDVKQGLQAYRQSLPEVSREAEVLARFGIFCAERQQVKAATTFLARAIDLGWETDAKLWWWLATSYDALGEKLAAIEAYRQVLLYEPDYPGIRQHVVALLEQNGQANEAADLLEQEIVSGQVKDVNATWEQILRLRGEDAQKSVVRLTRAGNNEFLVDVVIDNDHAATFLLDPQSEYTIISEDFAQQLKILLSANTSVVHFNYRGQRYTPFLINLSSVQIGKLAVRNVKTLMLDLSDVVPPIDGVLGSNFLKHFNAQIEREQQVLVLTKP